VSGGDYDWDTVFSPGVGVEWFGDVKPLKVCSNLSGGQGKNNHKKNVLFVKIMFRFQACNQLKTK